MIEIKSLRNERDSLLIVVQKQNDLIKKIKHFLDENISEEFHIYLSIDDDAELDFLDRTPRWHQDIARSGCADELEMEKDLNFQIVLMLQLL